MNYSNIDWQAGNAPGTVQTEFEWVCDLRAADDCLTHEECLDMLHDVSIFVEVDVEVAR